MYADLRGLSWAEAKHTLELESELIARVERADDPAEEWEAIEEELYESDDTIFGLDLGVASTAAALSAAKCIPFSSCNAGVFDGGRHQERYPLVAFFAKAPQIEVLLAATADADVGMVSYDDGCIVVYSGDVRKMRGFASALIARRDEFKTKTPRRRSAARRSEQYDMLPRNDGGPTTGDQP